MLDIPSLILINEENIEQKNAIKICKMVRKNEDNSPTPIVVLTSDSSFEHELELLKTDIEYCVKKPYNAKALCYMMRNIINLVATNRGISPLTKLPRKHSDSGRIKEAPS